MEEDGKVQIISLAHTPFAAIRPIDVIAVWGFDMRGRKDRTVGLGANGWGELVASKPKGRSAAGGVEQWQLPHIVERFLIVSKRAKVPGETDIVAGQSAKLPNQGGNTPHFYILLSPRLTSYTLGSTLLP